MRRGEGLRVSFDIDDIVVPSAEHLVGIYNEQHGTELRVEHWNSSRDPEHWGTETFADSVNRVTDILRSDRFNHTVEPIPGADRVFSRLAEVAELLMALTGRPEDIRVQTISMLETHHPGVFSDERVHFTDFYNRGAGGEVRDKVVIAKEFGITHHVEDHKAHAIPMARVGIKTALFGNYSWNQGGDDDFPPLVTRVGDMDGLAQYFEDEYANFIEYGPDIARTMVARRERY